MRSPNTKPDAERLARDLALMGQPGNWPRWPLLPLVKRIGNSRDADRYGFLIDDAGPVVFLGLIHGIPAAGPGGLPQRRYETMEALAADYGID